MDQWRIKHGKPHRVQVDAQVDDLPEMKTENITVTDHDIYAAIRDMQTSEQQTDAFETDEEGNIIIDVTDTVSAYETQTIPVIRRSMLYTWDPIDGYRDVARMLYWARYKYFCKYCVYPRTMTLSPWNWMNAYLRKVDYPIQRGNVKRDQVLCEG